MGSSQEKLSFLVTFLVITVIIQSSPTIISGNYVRHQHWVDRMRSIALENQSNHTIFQSSQLTTADWEDSPLLWSLWNNWLVLDVFSRALTGRVKQYIFPLLVLCSVKKFLVFIVLYHVYFYMTPEVLFLKGLVFDDFHFHTNVCSFCPECTTQSCSPWKADGFGWAIKTLMHSPSLNLPVQIPAFFSYLWSLISRRNVMLRNFCKLLAYSLQWICAWHGKFSGGSTNCQHFNKILTNCMLILVC